MLRVVIVVLWIGLIVATAATLQVIANWVLTLGFVLYGLAVGGLDEHESRRLRGRRQEPSRHHRSSA